MRTRSGRPPSSGKQPSARRQTDLRWKSARRFAENAAVLLAQVDGTPRVLNIDADLDGKDDI